MCFLVQLPASHGLYMESGLLTFGSYLLNTTFGTPFPGVVVDDLTIRVILPEGANSLHWLTPFDIDSADTTTRSTYLDYTGRPVIVLHKKNVLPTAHNKYFQASTTHRTTDRYRYLVIHEHVDRIYMTDG